MEYITRKEFEKLKEHGYTTSIAETILIHKKMYDEDITKSYEKLGYNVEKDMMILALENEGTVLKPVRIIEEQKGEK